VSCVAGGRALRVAPSGLVAVGIPAASSLSRIFVRIGNGLNGPTSTITIRCLLSGLCCQGIRIPLGIPSTPSTSSSGAAGR